MKDKGFLKIVEFIRTNYGINLEKKQGLISERIRRGLVNGEFTSFDDYYRLITTNKEELQSFLNMATTNYTYFLREEKHFDFLEKDLLPEVKFNNAKSKSINIWSAACSSGEEPYTLVMLLKNHFGLDYVNWDINILATDLSTTVLEKAKKGTYPSKSIDNLPNKYKKYFVEDKEIIRISDEIKKEVDFQQFNLIDKFPFKKKFDIILCKNVMIYFNLETRKKLISKFYNHLEDGGYLFIGLTESLTGIDSGFKHIYPSVYIK